MNAAPFVQELVPASDLPAAIRACRDWPQLAVLDSALVRAPLGRYSFLTADPLRTIVLSQPVPGGFPFTELRSLLPVDPAPTIAGLPPFQAGLIGLLSYELGACFERLPELPRTEPEFPAAVVNLYDWTLAWDHLQGRCWFIGRPELAAVGTDAAIAPQQRLEAVREALSRGGSTPELPSARPLSGGNPLSGHPGVVSNFSRAEYLRSVERVIEYICAGDIFQANLSQQLRATAVMSAPEMFLRLRRCNPAPFAGYFSHDDWAILSSSPERFLQLSGDTVTTRPIKGTRRRSPVPEADLFTRDELRESGKDQAENVMIVDLLRNDLSRVCRPGSIRVPQLCAVETYETVTHLVSEVRGQLREGQDFWDLLAATFPGGSITGAPKIRAMQIISELERVPRGAYCGSLFYLSATGAADSSILIRTMTHKSGELLFPAGGGVVADSDPIAEYEETLHKARGMLAALGNG